MNGAARVVSVNVGRTRTVEWQGRKVRTGIWKASIEGRVRTEGDRLEGDRHADGRMHGGSRKAIYAYPSEHYAYWREREPSLSLTWGAFGENLSTEDLLASDARVGDRLRIGSVELRVTLPCLPCYKLGMRFGREDLVKAFEGSGRFGFYLAIEKGGDVGAGDAIERVSSDPNAPTIAELVEARLKRSRSTLVAGAERAGKDAAS